MSTPITEYIAENIKTAINAITSANGFNQDLVAIRRKRVDFYNVAPEDGKVLIMQAEDDKPGQTVGCAEWLQKYLIAAIVIDSDSATDSIETKMAKVRDDIRKKLVEDTTRGGYAIDTINGPATPFDDGEGFTGIILEMDVHYRTQFADPYMKV
ncbi:MAG: hypothetical protein ABSG99_02695 [Sedimentisphaerales bacterium]